MAVDNERKSAVQFQCRALFFKQPINFHIAVPGAGLETRIKFVPWKRANRMIRII